MKVTISIENLLTPLLALTDSNKKWIADRLYESIDEKEHLRSSADEMQILQDIKEGMTDVKMGNTYPAENIFKMLK